MVMILSAHVEVGQTDTFSTKETPTLTFNMNFWDLQDMLLKLRLRLKHWSLYTFASHLPICSLYVRIIYLFLWDLHYAKGGGGYLFSCFLIIIKFSFGRPVFFKKEFLLLSKNMRSRCLPWFCFLYA